MSTWVLAVLLTGQINSGDGFNNDRPAAPPFRPTIVTDSPSDAPATLGARPGIGDTESAEVPASSFETRSAATADPRREVETADSPGRDSSTRWNGAAPATLTGAVADPMAENLKAAEMRLEELLAIDDAQRDELRAIRLIDLLSRGSNSHPPGTVITSYWRLTHAVGRVRMAGGKWQLLQEVPQPNDEQDRVVLDSAIASADAEYAAAQDELLAAQFRMLELASLSWEGRLPWPVDLPLVGTYRTNFDLLFAQRGAPLQLRYLHASFPGKLRLIERRAAAMAAAEATVDATLDSYRRGTGSLTVLLEMVERLDQARNAFLGSVIVYNERIAEYSLAAVGTGLEPSMLVATLIKSPTANPIMADLPRQAISRGIEAPALNAGEVQPASADAPSGFSPSAGQRSVLR